MAETCNDQRGSVPPWVNPSKNRRDTKDPFEASLGNSPTHPKTKGLEGHTRPIQALLSLWWGGSIFIRKHSTTCPAKSAPGPTPSEAGRWKVDAISDQEAFDLAEVLWTTGGMLSAGTSLRGIPIDASAHLLVLHCDLGGAPLSRRGKYKCVNGVSEKMETLQTSLGWAVGIARRTKPTDASSGTKIVSSPQKPPCERR